MRIGKSSLRFAAWVFGLAFVVMLSFNMDASAGDGKPKKPLPRKRDKERLEEEARRAKENEVVVSNFPYTEIREFDTIKLDTDEKETTYSRANKDSVLKILKSGKPSSAEEQKAVDDYVTFCMIQMTWEKNISNLPVLRDAVTGLLEEAGKAPDSTAHDLVIDTVLQRIKDIAQRSEIHPATRYNMILLATELNKTERVVGGKDPVPHPATLNAFLEVLSDTSSETLMKVGAMVGVERHSLFPMEETVRNRVAGDLTDFAFADPAKETPVQGWLRRKSLFIIQNLSEKAPDWTYAGMPENLAKVMANDKLEMPTRAAAALALGKIGADGMKPEEISMAWKGLGEMAIDIGEMKPGASVGAADKEEGAPPAGEEAVDEDYESEPYRDGAKYYLICVSNALKGIEPKVPTSDQQKFKSLSEAVQGMLRSCYVRNESEAQLSGNLYKQTIEIAKLLDTPAATPAAASAGATTTTR